MLSLALASLLAATSAPQSALERRAVDASALGVQLARAGKFEEALVQFKLAESLIPRRENVCNVALTYGRMKRWAQAWLFLEECRVRSVGAQPPPWLKDATATAERQLAAGPFALVTIKAPVDTTLTVTFPALSVTEPWRVLGERPAWLPTGAQQLDFEAGELKWSQQVEVVAGAVLAATLPRPTPPEVRVEVKVDAPVAPVAPPAVTTSLPEQPRPAPPTLTRAPRPLVVPLALGGLGVASGVFGAVMYGVARGSLDEASRLDPGPDYERVAERYRVERGVTWGAWIGGGALALAGLSWWLFGATPAVSVAPAFGPNGAALHVFTRF